MGSPNSSPEPSQIFPILANQETQSRVVLKVLTLPEPFPPLSWDAWAAKPLPMLHFHSSLGNHEKQKQLFIVRFESLTLPKPFPFLKRMGCPNPSPCFILSLPEPFTSPSWEPWKAQTPLHGSFWPFLNPSHPCMGSPNSSRCFILSLPKPYPPHSWEQIQSTVRRGGQKVFICFSWKSQDSSLNFQRHLSKKKRENSCPLGTRITPCHV